MSNGKPSLSWSLLDGLKSGFSSFPGRKATLPGIEKPDREVRDAATIIADKGPVAAHREVASFPDMQKDPGKTASRKAHAYGTGYMTGSLLAGGLSNLLLGAAAMRFPMLRPHARKLTLANTLHSGAVLSKMPNEMNRQVKQGFPQEHQAVSASLHSKAEDIRKKNSGGH